MDRKRTIFSKLELLILIITLGFGIVLIFLLAFSSLLSKKIPPSSQVSPVPSESPKTILPLSNQFIETISHLANSQEFLDYLKENFVLEEKDLPSSLSPQEIFERKKGNSFELAIFTSYVLWFQRYENSIIKYKTEKGRENSVVIFRDKDLPKTIVFTSQGPVIYHHGWSFEEMFQKEEERLGEKIKEYSLFYWSDAGKLLPEREEWESR